MSSVVVFVTVALRDEVWLRFRRTRRSGRGKTDLAEPIWVSKIIESRSTAEPEPVLVSTAVWGPFARPD